MGVTTTTFGQLLKDIRLNEAKMGLRLFADLIDMAPSNLSDIERGRKLPPNNEEKITQICNALGMANDDARRIQFFDLAANSKGRIPIDVANAIEENPAVPMLVRTVHNRQLSQEKIEKLTEHIKKYY